MARAPEPAGGTSKQRIRGFRQVGILGCGLPKAEEPLLMGDR